MVEDLPQYRTVGIQLGERYETSAGRVAGRHVRARRTPGTPTRRSTAPVRGRRMSGCGEGHALYDDFGPGFTLIDFGAPDDAAALADAARARGVPLKVLALTPFERQSLPPPPHLGSPRSAHCLARRPRDRRDWRSSTGCEARHDRRRAISTMC